MIPSNNKIECIEPGWETGSGPHSRDVALRSETRKWLFRIHIPADRPLALAGIHSVALERHGVETGSMSVHVISMH